MSTENNSDEMDRIGRPQVRTLVAGSSLEPMNDREVGAISNLVEWVAAEQDTTAETVRNFTGAHFGTPDVRDLASKDYEQVIRFLMDLRIDEMRDLPLKQSGKRGHHVENS